MSTNSWIIVLSGTLAVLVTGNMLVLDYIILSDQVFSPPQVEKIARPQFPETEVLETETVTYADPQLSQRLTQLEGVTSSLASQLKQLAQSSKTVPVPLVVNSTPVPVTKQSVREYYIPLGNGSATGTQWTELPGIEAYLVPANYGVIKSVYFEASLRIPNGTGQMWARLKNVTDGISLIESEVAHEGSTARLYSSGPIPVPNRTKLYRVELRSSFGSQVALDNARLKIFVE